MRVPDNIPGGAGAVFYQAKTPNITSQGYCIRKIGNLQADRSEKMRGISELGFIVVLSISGTEQSSVRIESTE